MKTFTYIIILFLTISQATAQTVAKDSLKSWFIGIQGGANTFYGDIKQSSKNNSGIDLPFNYAIGLKISKEFAKSLSIQGYCNMGLLSGASVKYDLTFNTEYLEYGAGMSINFTRLIKAPQDKVNLIFSGGFGLIQFRAQQKAIQTNLPISSYGYNSDGSKSDPTTEPVIPVGIGLRFNINSAFNVCIDYSLHSVMSDKLDSYNPNKTHDDRFSSIVIQLNYGLK